MKNTEVILLCHAVTHAMKAGVFPSAEDAIDPAGCSGLANRLGGKERRVVTSPARAARETAAAFASDATVDPSFADLDYGRWHGRSIRDVGDESAEGLGAWLSDPASAPHGGESLEQMAARVMAGLERHAREEPCVIITHALAIKAALARVLDAPLAAVYAMDFEPLAQVVLTHGDARWRLRVRAD
jgi:broad specificity phosphatase PhoE